MTRKEFLALCTASAAPALLRGDAGAAEGFRAAATLVVGPMLGHVGEREARIWLRASGAARVAVRIGQRADLGDARVVEGPMLQAADGFAGVVSVGGLEAGERYFYSVLLDREPVLAAPHAGFTTARPAGSGGVARVAFTSCVGKAASLAGAGWGEMAERGGIDLLLMLGDSHYADSDEIAKHRALYTAHRSVAGFAKLARTTPVLGVWDDHDFTANNSDGTDPGKDEALRAFREHWANPAFGEAGNPGVYFKATRGDVDFFMLDVRYHRSPDHAPDGPEKTMLGARQLDWLRRELRASRAKVKFIAGGSEWQSHGTEDSWASYLRERGEVFELLGEIEGVVLLSGDRHFTAAYQVEGRFIEVTSGPIGSANAPLPSVAKAPERFLGCAAGKLWCVFETDTTATPPAVALEVWMAGHGLVERRAFSWDEVNGRAVIAPSSALPLKAGK